MRIKVLFGGKKPEASYLNLLEHYTKCLSSSASLEILYLKNQKSLLEAASKEKGLICLDAAGKCMPSEVFSSQLRSHLEANGARTTFVIGPAEGLPEAFKRDSTLWSLSPLTFPHPLALLTLVEQVYRAFEMQKGSPYHRA
jgi:23S rRNA (pseudouridine1915-N3)-methyltransferase